MAGENTDTPTEGATDTPAMSSLDSIFSNEDKGGSDNDPSPESDVEDTDTEDSKPESSSKKDFPEPEPDASPEKDAKAKGKADPKKKEEKTPPEKEEKADKEEKTDDSQPDKDQKSEPDDEYKTLHKRLRDTQADWQSEHREKLHLEQQLKQAVEQITVLTKIADGTYDPEKDNPQSQITPEVVASKSLQLGKAVTSRNLAVREFGQEQVDERLAEFNSLFGKNQMVQDIVLQSDSPVHEAFRILDRYHFESKYGSNPEQIRKSIREEVEKELRDTLKKEITADLTEQLNKKKTTSRAFSSSRGSNGVSKESKSDSAHKRTPLSKLF